MTGLSRRPLLPNSKQFVDLTTQNRHVSAEAWTPTVQTHDDPHDQSIVLRNAMLERGALLSRKSRVRTTARPTCDEIPLGGTTERSQATRMMNQRASGDDGAECI